MHLYISSCDIRDSFPFTFFALFYYTSGEGQVFILNGGWIIGIALMQGRNQKIVNLFLYVYEYILSSVKFYKKYFSI